VSREFFHQQRSYLVDKRKVDCHVPADWFDVGNRNPGVRGSRLGIPQVLALFRGYLSHHCWPVGDHTSVALLKPFGLSKQGLLPTEISVMEVGRSGRTAESFFQRTIW